MTDGPGFRATYDERADALGITLAAARAHRTQQLGPTVRLDWGAGGELLFVEILSASSWYPLASLRVLTSPAIDLTIQEAARRSGLALTTLRDQIAKKRLQARKVGRDWIVTLADLHTYLANRGPQGRPAGKRKARRPKVPPVQTSAPRAAASGSGPV